MRRSIWLSENPSGPKNFFIGQRIYVRLICVIPIKMRFFFFEEALVSSLLLHFLQTFFRPNQKHNRAYGGASRQELSHNIADETQIVE